MTKCPNCKRDTDEPKCPACGTRVLSVDDDMVEVLVSQASIPNLASLFKAGKKAGLLKPQAEYGNTA